ncbi:MAG: hypothetical protein RIB60_11300 [Phycisphaerales bacterium]
MKLCTLLAALAMILVPAPASAVPPPLEGAVPAEPASPHSGGVARPDEWVETEGTPFTKVWTFRQDGSSRLQFGEVDLEGNVIVAGVIGGSVDEQQITKINGALNSSTAPPPLWLLQDELLGLQGGIPTLDAFAVDIDGNTYIAGYGDPIPNARVVKISPEGNILWSREYPGAGTVRDFVIDEEGIPFFAADSIQTGACSVLQIDPRDGAVAWRTDIASPSVQTCITGGVRFPRIAEDGAGGVYVWAASTLNAANSVLVRLRGVNGELDWCRQLLDFECRLNEPKSMIDDGEGGVIIVGSDNFPGGIPETNGVAYKYDSSGNRAWTYSFPGGNDFDVHFSTVTRGRFGEIVLGGYFWNSGAFDDAAAVFYLDDAGQQQWVAVIADFIPSGSSFNNTIERVVDLELDQVGNAYALTHHYFNNSTATQNYSVTKLEVASGAVLWQDFEPVEVPTYTELQPRDLVVDGGGNVFAISTPRGGTAVDGQQIVKYTQQFIGTPQPTQYAYVNLMFENKSIWTQGAGLIEAEADLFTQDWDLGIDIDEGFTVPAVGSFGGQFEFTTNGLIDVGVKAEVNGGSVDVQLPFSIEFDIPPITKITPGKPVTIDVDWFVDPAARMTSCFTPSFNAGLTAEVMYDNYGRTQLFAFGDSLISSPVFLDDEDFIPRDYVPELNLQDLLLRAGLPAPGEWFDIEIGGGVAETSFRTPQILAQGRYSTATNSFSSSATDRFFMFDINVTESVLKAFGATAQADFSVGGSSFGVAGAGELLQFRIGADLAAHQEIDVEVVPMVHYEFSDGITIPVNPIPITQDLVFDLPDPFDGNLEIRPTIMSTKAEFQNDTDIQVIPGLSWKTLEAGGTAWAFGQDILDLGPYCLLCYDWDLSEILQALQASDPGIVNADLDVFDEEWDIDFDDVPLPCLRVAGQTTNLPQVGAASRSSLRMLIYDQTSPTASSFNVTAGGTSKMLVYGNRLFTDSTARIEHWGRDEALPTTHINNNTLLVEIPDRFRLLPGIAKIYVTTGFGTSESIDLPITYPVPRLDTVNPNLWAADPDLAVLPVSVIDAKTFAGNDTYIARRDYYLLMDDLWSDLVDGGFDGDAREYFPDFDFDQMPGFPVVLWGGAKTGTPLARFVQPVDNGIHNVRLSEPLYNRPQAVPVAICNPGPGGGASNEIVLTIAAPQPVIATVEPNRFSPLDIEFDDDYFDPSDQPVAQPIKLRVTGPKHVPTFQGFEEPKYGNFNADSYVVFDRITLATQFIDSSLLIAELPPSMATIGDHEIVVITPSNGTEYFEEQRSDTNYDGTPETILFQGFVPSGGESAPQLFRVRYRDPVVATLSPPGAEQNSVLFTDPPANGTPYNLTVIGEDFRDGATVYFNGRARVTSYESAEKLRVTLQPEDVAEIGVFPITVQNPGPDYGQSGGLFFEVSASSGVPNRTLQRIDQPASSSTTGVLKP